jgi:hypothetical protein
MRQEIRHVEHRPGCLDLLAILFMGLFVAVAAAWLAIILAGAVLLGLAFTGIPPLAASKVTETTLLAVSAWVALLRRKHHRIVLDAGGLTFYDARNRPTCLSWNEIEQVRIEEGLDEDGDPYVRLLLLRGKGRRLVVGDGGYDGYGVVREAVVCNVPPERVHYFRVGR